MFNNIKSSFISKRARSIQNHTIPHFSTIKSSKKYYTPFKSNLTTMHTNNNTLLLNSDYSKIPPKKFFKQQKETSIIEMNKKSTGKSIKNKKSCSLKNKAKAKLQKKISTKVSKKPSLDVDKRGASLENKLVSNRQLYKGLRQGLNYQSTSLLLTKISQIFDLVLQKVKLPYQIQTFLFRPLEILKSRIQNNGKREIGKTLTQFKNNCMQVFKVSSSSEISLFQRMQLPRNNRWLGSTLNDTSTIKKQQEMQSRLASFQSLKKKGDRCDFRENETLNRIQNRLDDYLCKSVKYRKVYL